MSKKNDKPTEPRIDSHSEELLRHHKKKQKIGEEVQRRLSTLIDQLMKEFPEHLDVIDYYLEGQSARVLSIRTEAKCPEGSKSDGAN